MNVKQLGDVLKHLPDSTEIKLRVESINASSDHSVDWHNLSEKGGRLHLWLYLDGGMLKAHSEANVPADAPKLDLTREVSI